MRPIPQPTAADVAYARKINAETGAKPNSAQWITPEEVAGMYLTTAKPRLPARPKTGAPKSRGPATRKR